MNRLVVLTLSVAGFLPLLQGGSPLAGGEIPCEDVLRCPEPFGRDFCRTSQIWFEAESVSGAQGDVVPQRAVHAVEDPFADVGVLPADEPDPPPEDPPDGGDIEPRRRVDQLARAGGDPRQDRLPVRGDQARFLPARIERAVPDHDPVPVLRLLTAAPASAVAATLTYPALVRQPFQVRWPEPRSGSGAAILSVWLFSFGR